MDNGLIRVRKFGCYQVDELLPNVARALICSGTAEEVDEHGQPVKPRYGAGTQKPVELAAIQPHKQAAVIPRPGFIRAPRARDGR